MDYLKELNHNQYLAATSSSQYIRVVAGAGSGKTRVLTYRIAYLLEQNIALPWEILAITFTNKVAGEMKDRISKLIPSSTHELTIKTFHSFAALFLRREIEVLGYPRAFTIIDEEDQLKLIKDIAYKKGYKKSDPIVKKSINYISNWKLKEQYPEDVSLKATDNYEVKEILDIYTIYEQEKYRMFSLDFDDLLLKTNQILSQYPDIRFRWQNKYSHILVDEFQDTNNVEFKLISLLIDKGTSLYVVGDPDQTIYTWRGANQDIILKFQDRYFGTEDVVLDRNYRSTQTILDSANKLIKNNKLRLHKNLYTENNVGKPIPVRGCFTERAEAEYVCKQIKFLKQYEGKNYKDIVILYRSNYITKDFEHALTSAQIPYKIYGGLKFFQRKEIKDVIAYFRLISNLKDDISFERIINVPRRNIGNTTLDKLKKEALEHKMSIYEYIANIDLEETELSNKTVNTLQTLIYRMDRTRNDIENDSEMFAKILEDLIIDIGYYDYLEEEDDNGDDRLLNVKTLFEDIRYFIKKNPESTFDEYLQNVSLISGQDEVSTGDFVTLMTVHTAKGLEFPVVFLVRLNDSVFPSARALQSDGFHALEEERRLCYVAITRAKQQLFVSYVTSFSYVAGCELKPSQFIYEAGLASDKTLNTNNARTNSNPNFSYSRPTQTNNDYFDKPKQSISTVFKKVTNDVDHWSVGDICIHKKYGAGKVVEVEGDGAIVVYFPTEGRKTLMGNHPALSKGGHEA